LQNFLQKKKPRVLSLDLANVHYLISVINLKFITVPQPKRPVISMLSEPTQFGMCTFGDQSHGSA